MELVEKVSGVICDQRVAAKGKGKVYKKVVGQAMLFDGGRVKDVEVPFGSDEGGQDYE